GQGGQEGGERALRGGHARGAAAVQECIPELRVVPGRCYEEAARVLDAVGRDPAQDRVLDHALARRNRILDRVAPARVQEAVKAARRPRGEIASLDEHRREAAHRRVARDAGPGRAAADDENDRFESGPRPGVSQRVARRDWHREGAFPNNRYWDSPRSGTVPGPRARP